MAVDPQTVARHLRARQQSAKEAARLRADELRARLPEVARILKEAGATQVWVFGSLARGEWSLRSDVDLAVLGLPRARYIEALTRASEILGAVDLVRLEQASDSLRERVAEEGAAL